MQSACVSHAFHYKNSSISRVSIAIKTRGNKKPPCTARTMPLDRDRSREICTLVTLTRRSSRSSNALRRPIDLSVASLPGRRKSFPNRFFLGPFPSIVPANNLISEISRLLSSGWNNEPGTCSPHGGSWRFGSSRTVTFFWRKAIVCGMRVGDEACRVPWTIHLVAPPATDSALVNFSNPVKLRIRVFWLDGEYTRKGSNLAEQKRKH